VFNCELRLHFQSASHIYRSSGDSDSWSLVVTGGNISKQFIVDDLVLFILLAWGNFVEGAFVWKSSQDGNTGRRLITG
jgi:hypothetical protein